MKTNNSLFISFLFLSLFFISCSNKFKQVDASTNVDASLTLGALNSMDLPDITLETLVTNECTKKFETILALLPAEVKLAVLEEFKKNTSTDSCCDKEATIAAASKAFSKIDKKFYLVMTVESKKIKKGFSCIRAPEIAQLTVSDNRDKEAKSENTHLVKSMLKSANKINSSLLKCKTMTNQIALQNIGLMCSAKSSLPVFFNVDESTGKVTGVKKLRSNESKLFDSCKSYLDNYSEFSNSSLNSFIDGVNYLTGVSQCNYFSNSFQFDPETDKNDPMFPLTAKNEVTLGSSNLLTTWYNCASTNSNFDKSKIDLLRNNYIQAEQDQPMGLSTYIGRYDINYEIIKKSFPLSKYPSFHVSCLLGDCTAYCPNCSNLIWNSKGVVSTSTTKLEVSCCNSVCVIWIQIQDIIHGRTEVIPGAEIFLIRGEKYARDFDPLTLVKLRNAEKSFIRTNEGNLIPTSIITTTTNGTSSTSYTTGTATLIGVDQSETQSVATKVKFQDDQLEKRFEEILKKPSDFVNDFRYNLALSLYINIDGKSQKLLDYIQVNLYNNTNAVYLGCENGSCKYQCDTCTDKEYKLEPNLNPEEVDVFSNPKLSFNNNTTTSTSMIQTNNTLLRRGGGSRGGGSRGGSRSSSRSSSSRSSSRSSGGSKSGSSLTRSSSKGGSALTRVSTKSGSSLTSSSAIKTKSSSYASSKGSSFKSSTTLRSPVSTSFTKPNKSNYYVKNKSKVKVKFYSRPSYGYHNTYSYLPVYRYYSPYYYYPYLNNYNSYYVYGYSPYYYSPRRTFYKGNYNYELAPEYDASDWLPLKEESLNSVEYINMLNTKINDLKIYVECSNLFCVLLIDTIDDGLKTESGKKRIFINVTTRSVGFVDSETISLPQKKCFIEKVLSSSANPAEQCKIDFPYDILPVKTHCMTKMTSTCTANNFKELVTRASGPTSEQQYCELPTNCMNLTESSSNADKEKCGANLYDLLMYKGYRPLYSKIAFPCNVVPTTTSTNLMEIAKAYLAQTSTGYVDESSLTTEQKAELSQAQTSAESKVDTSAEIDGSTALEPRSDTESEALAINSNVEAQLSDLSSKVYSFTLMSALIISLIIIN